MASPIVHVTPDDPPMFLYHGSMDRLVDVSHARDMKRALDTAGVPGELYIVTGLGHLTTFIWSDAAVDRAISFLENRLAPRVDKSTG